MKKKLVTYLLTIVLILSCVWVDPIRSYGQTEDEISSAEDVSNTEADQESFEKSELCKIIQKRRAWRRRCRSYCCYI